MNKAKVAVCALFLGTLSFALHGQQRDIFQLERQLKNSVSPQNSANMNSEKPDVEELTTAVYPLRFVDAKQLFTLIEKQSLLGLIDANGGVTVDERTNSLIVRSRRSQQIDIAHILQALDVPVQQVDIEARVVVMDDVALNELGVRWGIQKSASAADVSGSLEGINLPAAGLDSLLNVNLPATSSNASSMALRLSKLGSGVLLDMELSALQSESKAKVIASPRLVTLDRQAAYIEQGTEIPYSEPTKDGDSHIEFKKAVLSLNVTPIIMPNHKLLLTLHVTQDRPGEVVKTGNGEAIAIVTQRLSTQVMVDDGETLVLGGIKQHSETTTQDKVPLLGDLPGIGALFRRNYSKQADNELIIFVTPKLRG